METDIIVNIDTIDNIDIQDISQCDVSQYDISQDDISDNNSCIICLEQYYIENNNMFDVLHIQDIPYARCNKKCKYYVHQECYNRYVKHNKCIMCIICKEKIKLQPIESFPYSYCFIILVILSLFFICLYSFIRISV